MMPLQTLPYSNTLLHPRSQKCLLSPMLVGEMIISPPALHDLEVPYLPWTHLWKASLLNLRQKYHHPHHRQLTRIIIQRTEPLRGQISPISTKISNKHNFPNTLPWYLKTCTILEQFRTRTDPAPHTIPKCLSTVLLVTGYRDKDRIEYAATVLALLGSQ
jgi:hypothetical protein